MLTQAELKSILHYNPETGIFSLKTDTARRKKWQVVGVHDNGYLRINILKPRKSYLAHRLAWLYVYGYIPNCFIDHIDSNRSNNKIKNLRLATNTQNQWNTGISKKNTSGYKGVHYVKSTNKWYSMAQINKKNYYLGTFETAELASEAYLKLVNIKHGEFVYPEYKKSI